NLADSRIEPAKAIADMTPRSANPRLPRAASREAVLGRERAAPIRDVRRRIAREGADGYRVGVGREVSIDIGDGRAHREIIRHRPRGGAFKTLGLGRLTIAVHAAEGRNENEQLNVRPLDEVEGGVELQAAVKQIRLDADLVVDRRISLESERHARRN